MTDIASEEVRRAEKKGYIGVHFERGVPVLDRDLDLLDGLTAEHLRLFSEVAIGEGAVDDGFSIRALPDGETARDDFLIGAGAFLAGGLAVRNAVKLRYSAQSPAPPPLSPPGKGARTDRVYLEIRAEIVGEDRDPDLANPGDVGLSTSTRRRLVWSVRVAEDGALPLRETGAGGALTCVRAPLAEIAREPGAGIEDGMIRDLRSSRLSVASLGERLSAVEMAFAPAIETVASRAREPRSGGPKVPYRTSLEIRGRRLFDVGLTVTVAGQKIDGATIKKDPAGARLAFPLPDSVPAGEIDVVVRTPFGEARRTIPLRERWETINALATDAAVTWPADDFGDLPLVVVLGTVPNSGSGAFAASRYDWGAQRLLSPATSTFSPVAASPYPDSGPKPAENAYFVLWSIDKGQVVNTAKVAPPANATDVGVGTDDKANVFVYRVDKNKVSHVESGKWTDPDPVPDAPVEGVKIAVDPRGFPWIATAAGELYFYDPDSPAWVRLSAPPVADLAIGPDGVVWILGGDEIRKGVHRAYSRRGAEWLPSDAEGTSINVDLHGVPWIVDDVHAVRYRTLEVWSWP